MKNNIIREYTYNWIAAILDGRKLNGHDFFSDFPRPEKENINSTLLNLLYTCIESIDQYGIKKGND